MGNTIVVRLAVWGPEWLWVLVLTVLGVLFIAWAVRFVISVVTGG